MFDVQFDAARNILKLTYSGRVCVEEIHAGIDKLPSLLAGAKPEFRLLTDVTHLTEMDISCTEPIGLAMDVIKKAGVNFVVRVIPSPVQDIGFNILSIFHYGRSVRMTECTNLEEAETLLR